MTAGEGPGAGGTRVNTGKGRCVFDGCMGGREGGRLRQGTERPMQGHAVLFSVCMCVLGKECSLNLSRKGP